MSGATRLRHPASVWPGVDSIQFVGMLFSLQKNFFFHTMIIPFHCKMASHIYTSFVSQTKCGSPVEGWLGWWQLQTQLLTPPELQMARVLVPNKVRPPHWSIVPSPALWLVKCLLRSRSPGDVCGIKIDESPEVGEIVFEYLDPRSSLWSLDTVSLHTHSCVRQRRPDIRHPPLLLSLHPIDPCLDLDQSEASIQVTWSLPTNQSLPSPPYKRLP